MSCSPKGDEERVRNLMSKDFVSWPGPEPSGPQALPPAGYQAKAAGTSALRPKAFGPVPAEGLRPAGGRRAVVVCTFFGGAPAPVRVGLILAALTAALLTGSSCGGLKPPSAASAPPTPVVVVKAIQMDVPVHAEWVATLEGYVNAQIQPQVSGYLIRQDYQEGSYVHTVMCCLKSTRGRFKRRSTKLRGNWLRRGRNSIWLT